MDNTTLMVVMVETPLVALTIGLVVWAWRRVHADLNAWKEQRWD